MQTNINEENSNEQNVGTELRTLNQPHEADCATRAYFIWLAEGCPEGCDQQHWFAAEELLRKPETYDAGQAS